MDLVFNNRGLAQIDMGENIAFALREESLFHESDYKVMRNQDQNTFIKCTKLKYNGYSLLYYQIANLSAFNRVWASQDQRGSVILLANMLKSVLYVKKNGFLSCNNIDLDFNHVFVDVSTLQVHLLYFPIRGKEEQVIFEEPALKRHLVQLVSSSSTISESVRTLLIRQLSNVSLTLDDLVCSIPALGNTLRESQPDQSFQTCVLHSINSPFPFQLTVNKNSFLLGRKEGQVDGLIAFNNAIGRVHCRIDRTEQGYVLVDLNSANGTFLNSTRLVPNIPHVIKHGDIIRLANSDFMVEIGGSNK